MSRLLPIEFSGTEVLNRRILAYRDFDLNRKQSGHDKSNGNANLGNKHNFLLTLEQAFFPVLGIAGQLTRKVRTGKFYASPE